MTINDWVDGSFPGDGFELPTCDERDRADELITRWNKQWAEDARLCPRTHPDVTGEGFANFLAGRPTNRAYLRCHLRRWWARTDTSV